MSEEEYKIRLEKIAMTENSITIICFTLLSIIFNSWWIIFFSIIFWVRVKDKKESN